MQSFKNCKMAVIENDLLSKTDYDHSFFFFTPKDGSLYLHVIIKLICNEHNLFCAFFLLLLSFLFLTGCQLKNI
jgi:hypothetical protein